MGVHFHVDGDPPHPNAARWSVMPLPISRTKRYQDGSTANKFWTTLDNNLYTKKDYLTPPAKKAALQGLQGGAA